MSANVPELRFSGFADPWEQRKLGDLYRKCTEKNDGTYNTNSIISVAGMSYSPETRVTEQSYLGTYNVMRLGDIAFEGHANRVFSHGRFVENDLGIGIVSHIFDVFRPKVEYDLSYWRYAINNESLMRNVLIRSTKASTMMHNLVTSDFLKQSIPVPTVAEQKKIGGVLVRLDSLIALHQRKHNQLSVLKGSLLEGMFPKPGSDVPELRFSGFADPWEQRKLGEVVAITMGQSPQGTSYTDNPNDAILVQGNADLKDGWVTPRVWTTEATKTAAAGSLIMSVRAPVGAMGKTRYDVVLGRGVAGLDGDEFLFQLLSKFEAEGYWFKVSVGSTFDSINGDDLRNAPIAYPHNASERVQIGEALGRLDSLIALHQRKLEKLRALKQSLLQKMFV